MFMLSLVSLICLTPSAWSGATYLPLSLTFTEISLGFSLVVALVTFVVLIWSKSYLSDLKSYQAWFLITLSFVFSMFLFILSESCIMMVVCFDLLGVTSYLLISYYKSKSVMNSATITLMLSKIGDLTLMLSLFLELGGLVSSPFLLMVSMLTKSAFIPFSSWLPLAMAAPTPISALVHSSTLVTAGVLLSMKNPLMTLNNLLLMFSVSSMFFASFLAVLETDYKKVVAMSTMSQMSMIGLFFSQGLFVLGVFHLTTHAFFKSLMFISVGEVLHSSGGSQLKPSLNHNKSVTSSLLFLSGASLTGQMYTSGFSSKEILLEMFETQSGALTLLMNMILLAITFLYVGALLVPLASVLSGTKKLSFMVLCYSVLTLGSAVLIEQKMVLPEVFSMKVVGLLFPILMLMFLALSGTTWSLLWLNLLFSSSFTLLNSFLHSFNMDLVTKNIYWGMGLLISVEVLLTPLVSMALGVMLMI